MAVVDARATEMMVVHVVYGEQLEEKYAGNEFLHSV
jgi:hypothetical protein